MIISFKIIFKLLVNAFNSSFRDRIYADLTFAFHFQIVFDVCNWVLGKLGQPVSILRKKIRPNNNEGVRPITCPSSYHVSHEWIPDPIMSFWPFVVFLKYICLQRRKFKSKLGRMNIDFVEFDLYYVLRIKDWSWRNLFAVVDGSSG